LKATIDTATLIRHCCWISLRVSLITPPVRHFAAIADYAAFSPFHFRHYLIFDFIAHIIFTLIFSLTFLSISFHYATLAALSRQPAAIDASG